MTYPENLEKYFWDHQPDKSARDYGVPGREYCSKEEYERRVAEGSMRPKSEWDTMRDDEMLNDLIY